MYSSVISLNEAKIGEICTVCSLLARGEDRRRLLDLGLIQGTKIEILGKSPFGDPTAYSIRGAIIALRCDDAEKIIVKI